ncbi:GLPGLI family protein [Chryseobacterium ginsenosidimutans]|uniref:GLPGLI family protein n=1 Tax=Chryseobacterium ginsenosidimutans TaxID=687846 RepID=UPI00278376EA|nr:GLPGLI family protein [Chryseobacterium ginsenosidimutans]MDQ0591661.1 GLPGLI family protein [Chryseobacterium ginsenosidimutans]
MKNRFILLIFIFIYTFLFGQNKAKLEVRYNMKFIPDSTNKIKSGNFDLILLCNENESIYYSPDAKKYYDYLYEKSSQMVGGKISLGSLPTYPKVRGIVYKKNNIITATLPLGKYNYSFDEPQLNWELQKETKTINGMKCNLAKVKTDTNDTFFAWYTQQYQFSEGPFRFKGLPGLIIELYNTNKTIWIQTAEIKKSDEEIKPLSLGSVIKLKSKNEFIKARTTYHENPNTGSFGDNITIRDDKGNDYSKMRKEKISGINVFLD